MKVDFPNREHAISEPKCFLKSFKKIMLFTHKTILNDLLILNHMCSEADDACKQTTVNFVHETKLIFYKRLLEGHHRLFFPPARQLYQPIDVECLDGFQILVVT